MFLLLSLGKLDNRNILSVTVLKSVVILISNCTSRYRHFCYLGWVLACLLALGCFRIVFIADCCIFAAEVIDDVRLGVVIGHGLALVLLLALIFNSAKCSPAYGLVVLFWMRKSTFLVLISHPGWGRLRLSSANAIVDRMTVIRWAHLDTKTFLIRGSPSLARRIASHSCKILMLATVSSSDLDLRCCILSCRYWSMPRCSSPLNNWLTLYLPSTHS